MKAFSKIITWLIVVVFLFGVIGLLYAFIGNGYRNFYITYENETIINEKKGVELLKGSYSVFYCNTLIGQTVSYDVQIYLNVKSIENFDFSVDGNRKNFKSDFTEYDCSKLFNISKSETCFMLSVPNDITLEKAIQAKYPDKAITGVPSIKLDAKDSFILTVTSGIEKLKTQIYFC